jgi:hypothetical protein
MSSIFEDKLVPYKDKDYSYISRNNKKDFTPFELFRILIIAIVSVFWEIDVSSYMSGSTYKIKQTLADPEKEWVEYLEKIPVFNVKNILLKIEFDKIKIIIREINKNYATINIKIDENLFNNLKGSLPSNFLDSINYCVITNENFYKDIYLKKLKNIELHLKGNGTLTLPGAIKNTGLGPPPGKKIKNHDKNKHKSHVASTYIIPLIYLIYSYIYIKYYKNVKCKKIFIQSKLDYELYNNVFSYRNPVIKKVNVYLDSILKDESNNVRNKANNNSKNSNKNNSKKNVIEDIKNGTVKDILIKTIDFIDEKIEKYDVSEKNIKTIKNVIRLLESIEKNIDFIQEKFTTNPAMKDIYDSIPPIDKEILKICLDKMSSASQTPAIFTKYRQEYSICLNYYIDIIKNIGDVNKNLLNYIVIDDRKKTNFNNIIEAVENEKISKNIISDLKDILNNESNLQDSIKDNYNTIKDQNNNLKDILKIEKEIIENIFDESYSNKKSLIEQLKNKKNELYSSINAIVILEPGSSSMPTQSTTTGYIMIDPCNTSSAPNNSNYISIGGNDIDNILNYSTTVKNTFNTLLINIYKSITSFEYFEYLYLNKINGINTKVIDRPNNIDTFRLDFEKEFREFQNNDTKKYTEEIKKLEEKKDIFTSKKDEIEYEFKKYSKTPIENKINNLTKNEKNKIDEGDKIKELKKKIEGEISRKEPAINIIRKYKDNVFRLGIESDKKEFDENLPPTSGVIPDDGITYLKKCLDEQLDKIKYNNLSKKKNKISSNKKNKELTSKNKNIDRPLSDQRLENSNNIISFIDKEINNIQTKKNSNTSNKNMLKTTIIKIFVDLFKYSNDMKNIQKTMDFKVVNNKIYHFYTNDTTLEMIIIENNEENVIKLLNNYYIGNNTSDKFINSIYDTVIKNNKFPNDDVKIFFDKYKEFSENLSTTIINLLNYIDKNNIKKFNYIPGTDIFKNLIKEKNDKICKILDSANIVINNTNGKYIKILPYTDIFHVYIMIFLIFIDYLNYYYFCEIGSGVRGTPPTSPPTGPPTNPPTGPPTGPPTSPPTSPPTGPPTSPPTSPPTGPPTSPPTSPPTGPPTSPPTNPPTNPPTGLPTSPPTSPPTGPPTSPPTGPPTGPPTSPPTGLPNRSSKLDILHKKLNELKKKKEDTKAKLNAQPNNVQLQYNFESLRQNVKKIENNIQSKLNTNGEKINANEKAKINANTKAKINTNAKAKINANEKAKINANEKAKINANEKAKINTNAKAKENANEKAKINTNAKAKENANAKAKINTNAKAKENANAKAKINANAKAKENTKKYSPAMLNIN